MKIIKNVLINTKENKLKPAFIRFNEKILDVQFISDIEIDWSEIDTLDKKNSVMQNIKSDIQFEEPTIIDGNYNLLMYGSLDAHVHFNTPGFESREDIEHASYSAAAGGVTTVIDMPCTSIPPVTTVKNLLLKKEALKGRSRIDYGFWGGINSGNADINNTIKKNIEHLIGEGVPGFKVYTISGMTTFKDLSYADIFNIADIMKKTKSFMAVHAEDKFLIKTKTAELQFKNHNDWHAYCEARSVEAEAKAVENIVGIAAKTGARFHIVHLSSKRGLDLIRDAKKKGIKISTETCPHYLYFTQKDFDNKLISNFLKTAPPVKFEEDKESLWEGLSDGTIDYITTDHAGCDPMTDKTTSNFWNVYGGIPGVQHRVPFLFSFGFKTGKLTLSKTIELLNPYSFFLFESKGAIAKDFDADFAIIDLWNSEKTTYANMLSKGKYTPFEGVEFNSIVNSTFLRGDVIYDRNNRKNELKEKKGEFLRVVS
ncbi:MAG: amidohydrolase family protein [bacterium]